MRIRRVSGVHSGMESSDYNLRKRVGNCVEKGLQSVSESEIW